MKNIITIEASINVPIAEVWDYFTQPQHIVQWNYATKDWHCTKATNNLKVGENFSSRMEAKDGSFGFDFEGIYQEVIAHQKIIYKMPDERKVEIDFIKEGNQTKIIERFEAENDNPIEMQQQGWQLILNNFKTYVEGGGCWV